MPNRPEQLDFEYSTSQPPGLPKESHNLVDATSVQADRIIKLAGRDDQNLVDFEGPKDPEAPLNWTSAKKTVAVSLVSFMVMVSYAADNPSGKYFTQSLTRRCRHTGSTISSSVASDVMTSFGATSPSLGTFVTTVYLMGYAFGPMVIAPLSELYGRALLYKTCIALAVIFHTACALANSLGSLIAFRLLAGMAASSPLTLGPGTIADMFVPKTRGPPITAFVVGASLGQAIGPVLGGYLLPVAGWRWTFWFMAIASGVLAVAVFALMDESYPPVLLKRKTRRLRRETGNIHLRSVLEVEGSPIPPRDLFIRSITRPLRMLVSPIVFLISLYVAVVYSYLYLCFTTFPRVFKDQYGFDSGRAGLATLGMGVGSLVGVAMSGAVADRLSIYLATKKSSGNMLPEYRLPTMTLGGFLVPVGLFWYAWTAETKTHWIAPIIGTGFLGAGLIVTYVSNHYFPDLKCMNLADYCLGTRRLRAPCISSTRSRCMQHQ